MEKEHGNPDGIQLLLAMTYCVLTALRIPWMDRFYGGLPRALRSHRNVGILTAALLFLHWTAAKGPQWPAALGLMEASAGNRGLGADPSVLDEVFDFLKAAGEWLGYAMIILLFLALFGFFLRHNAWIRQHRLFGLLTLLGALHGIGSVPKTHQESLAMATAVVLTILCGWLFSRQFDLDFSKPKKGLVTHAEQIEKDLVRITIRPTDQNFSFKSGQFVRLSFDESECPHPFTVTEAGKDGLGRTEFTVIVKALGGYTRKIQKENLVGREAFFQGPYGGFMRSVPPNSLWVAGDIGISPFIAKLNDRNCRLEGVTLVWCFRSEEENLLRHVEHLCMQRDVRLFAFNAATGRRMGCNGQLGEITKMKPNETFFCGPAALGKALCSCLRAKGITEVKSEYFSWR